MPPIFDLFARTLIEEASKGITEATNEAVALLAGFLWAEETAYELVIPEPKAP